MDGKRSDGSTWAEGSRLSAHAPALLFLLAALVGMVFLAGHVYDPDTHRLQAHPPQVWHGDCPHYLLMIWSEVTFGRLEPERMYDLVAQSGLQAGSYIRHPLDHHTVIEQLDTGRRIRWERLFDLGRFVPYNALVPASTGYPRVRPDFPDYTRTNPRYREYFMHPPLFPLSIAWLLEICRVPRDHIESGALYMVVAISWVALVATYMLGLYAGLRPSSATCAVALLTLASPWLVYSHQLFPMTWLGLLLLGALWGYVARAYVVAAFCLAIATHQMESFLLIFPAWAWLLYRSGRSRDMLLFVAASVAALGTMAVVNLALTGALTNRDLGPWADRVPWGLLLSPYCGIIPFAPWVAAGLLLLMRPRTPSADLAGAVRAAMLVMVVLYMLLPFSGGNGYGPRYWVPLLPWMALALMGEWNRRPPGPVVAGSLAVLVLWSAVVALSAALLFDPNTWNATPWQTLGHYLS